MSLSENWSAASSSSVVTDIVHDGNTLHAIGYLRDDVATGVLETFTLNGIKTNQVEILPLGSDLFYPYNFAKTDNGFNLIALDQDYDLIYPFVNQINLIAIDLSGQVTWSKTIAAGIHPDRFDIVKTSNYSYVFGTTQETIFLSKYDNNGNMQWTSSDIVQESSNSVAKCIATDDKSNIYFGGSTGYDSSLPGSGDGLIGKSDANGNIDWVLNIGTTAYDEILDIVVDDYGNAYYIGYSYTNGGGDVLVGSISPSGESLWQSVFGGNGQDWGISLAISGENLIAVGYTNNGINGYSGFLGGGRNGFAVSLNTSSGSIQSTKYIGVEGEHLTLSSSLIDGNILFLGGHHSSESESKGIIYSYNILSNNTPSNLFLSSDSIDENTTLGSSVATLSTSDPDSGDTHTYSLISGTGDTDNSSFTIDGNELKINASPDFETQNSYSVRLRTTDSGGLSYEKSFTFAVNDIKPETIRSSTNLTLPDNVENLILTGTGNLKGYGNSDSNRLTGNSGNNVLNGKGGIDAMSGKGGNDTYIVDELKDRVIEKADGGTDTIKSSVNETLSANVENLVLTGSGNLKGYGNSSNNRLTGNSGNNVLEGKGGRDILTGKGGSDKYVYRSVDDSGVTNSTRDVITDFSPFIDQIDLSKIDAYTGANGNQTFVYIGSNLFSGTQGEVRFASSILGVNAGTDTKADMQIKLNGVTEFSSDFLIL